MKKKTIKIPIFSSSLTIIIDKDLVYTEKKYKTKDLSNYGAVTLENPKDNTNIIVSFHSKNIGLIAHEVVHIINYIFLRCGIELDRINDETQAYLSGWLVEEINKFLNPS